MRLFLALNLSGDIREGIHEATTPLREVEAPVRWVGADALHLTLKFLGEVTEDDSPSVESALAAVVGRHSVLGLTVGGIGMFPGGGRPRVVWLGAESGPALPALHEDLEAALQGVGFPPEPKPFRAHVTLGRTRRRLKAHQVAALRHAAETVDYQAHVRIATVDLMRSHLGGGRPRYEALARVALDSSAGDREW